MSVLADAPLPSPATVRPHPVGHATHAAETAVQRLADASVWVLFRISRVRS